MLLAGIEEKCSTMGWERRGNGEYYYRKVRRGMRVISEYAGCGDYAFLTALLDEERRVERQEHCKVDQRNREDAQRNDCALAMIDDTLRALTIAALEKAGYRRHKGQ